LEKAPSPSLDQISLNDDDTLQRWIRDGNPHAPVLIDFLCEIFAEWAAKTGLPRNTAKTRYLAWVMHGIPYDDVPGPTSFGPPIDVMASTFPFKKLTKDSIPEANGDKFFNAVPQGPHAAAHGWIVPRRELWVRLGGKLRQPANSGSWDFHLISGPSGSGKSTLLQLISWEALQNGYDLFVCTPQYADPESFYGRVATVLERASDHVVLVVDNANILETRGVELRSLLSFPTARTNQSVDVVLAGNWPAMRSPLPMQIDPKTRQRSLISLPPFCDKEIDELLEIICNAERDGSISEVRCDLSKDGRLDQLKTERDRLPLIALFKLRYAKNLREFLSDEISSSPADTARVLFARIAIMDLLGCPLPRSCLRAVDSVSRRWIESLIYVDESALLHVSHRLLAKPIVDAALPDLSVRPDFLVETLLHLASNSRWSSILSSYLTTEGLGGRLLPYLGYAKKSVLTYAELLHDELPAFKEYGFGAQLHCHLGVTSKDILRDFVRARKHFESALEIEPDNAFAAVQLSWSLFQEGDTVEAEAAARDAITRHPNHQRLMSDCAFICSWCSRPGFVYAGEVYAKLIVEVAPGDVELTKKWERYLEAKRVVEAGSSDGFADYELEAMSAPAFVWRVRRNARKYGAALFNKAVFSLRDSDVEPEFLLELEESSEGNENRGLQGLVKAHLARQQYERWYRDNDPHVDLDHVQAMFEGAIELKPDPFIYCWLGTYFKEARNDYKSAEDRYLTAYRLANSSKFPSDRNHPMMANNLALLEISKAYKQICPAAQVLAKAERYTDEAIRKMDLVPEFTWPLETQARLRMAASDFGFQLQSALAG